MELITERYISQRNQWPERGRHILSQFDDNSIVVYQAYRASIGHFAARHKYFGGGGFKFDRMSWIKPSFLWMMHRSGWGTKEGQEVVLAVWLERAAFDVMLEQAVHSGFVPGVYLNREAWKEAIASSSVRLQWDPDHDPTGKKVERRAIQLGLRGKVLEKYARDWIVDIQDISGFVAHQREHAHHNAYSLLCTPLERVYPVKCREVAKRLQITTDFG
jgi:hypothetical protein